MLLSPFPFFSSQSVLSTFGAFLERMDSDKKGIMQREKVSRKDERRKEEVELEADPPSSLSQWQTSSRVFRKRIRISRKESR